MQPLKFAGNCTVQKAFAKAVKQNVYTYFKDNNLSIKGNWTMVVQSSVMLLLYLVPFIIILLIPVNAWIALLLAMLMGVGAAGIGMCVMHDAAHGSYSSKNWVNSLMGSSMYLMGGSLLMWKIQHNVKHHTYTNIEGYDEDIAIRGPIRLSEFAPISRFHKYQYIHAFFFYGLLTIAGLTKDFGQLAAYTKDGTLKNRRIHVPSAYIRLVLVKLVYLFGVIGLPLLLTSLSWWQVLIGFFAMHWVAGVILSIVFQMAHVVEGTEQMDPAGGTINPVEWAVHQLRTTSNFARNNVLLNWYVGGLNFQIEHHLFPHICHIHYRRISSIVQQTALEFGVPYNIKPSLRYALGSHVRRLRELGLPMV